MPHENEAPRVPSRFAIDDYAARELQRTTSLGAGFSPARHISRFASQRANSEHASGGHAYRSPVRFAAVTAVAASSAHDATRPTRHAPTRHVAAIAAARPPRC